MGRSIDATLLVMRATATLFAVLVLALPSRSLAYTVKHTASGETVRWQVASVGVHVHASLAERVPGAHRAAAVAVDAWRGYGAPDLVLDPELDTVKYVPGAAGTQIVMPDAWPYAPGLLAMTLTTHTEDGEILDADILVNRENPLALLDERSPDATRFDIGAVLTHEMGHVLGLGESHADRMATMWPRIGPGDTHQRTLAQDDEDGITAAYRGATLAPVSGCGGASVSARSGALPWALVIAALACVIALARRRSSGMALGLALALFCVAAAPNRGERVIAVTRDADGFVHTRVAVRGRVIELPGGCIDGICQRVEPLLAAPTRLADREVTALGLPRPARVR